MKLVRRDVYKKKSLSFIGHVIDLRTELDRWEKTARLSSTISLYNSNPDNPPRFSFSA
jgi:hypothetical protein